ncbi:hypothetical protein BC831DRAFT_550894 [Entophlyctis helioformis]|nr:hypothetical protein BC831DRAFT_550894 [Entophlyctis helioformis]
MTPRSECSAWPDSASQGTPHDNNSAHVQPSVEEHHHRNADGTVRGFQPAHRHSAKRQRPLSIRQCFAVSAVLSLVVLVANVWLLVHGGRAISKSGLSASETDAKPIAIADPNVAPTLAGSLFATGRHAHAIVVCDAGNVDRALVLLAGLADTGTTAARLLIVSTDTASTIAPLLDRMQRPVEVIEIPHVEGAAEQSNRAACINNALVHAWNVTAYSRIALANPSIMVPVQQPDTVFLLPHLSGTRDERDNLDGGLLVFAPDASIATALAARFAETPAAVSAGTDTLTRALAVLQATIAQSLAKGKTAGSHNGPFTVPSRLVPPIALYASDPDVRSSAAFVRLSPSVNPWTIRQHVRLASDNDLGSLGLGNIDGGDDKVKRKMEQWAYSNRSDLVCRPFMASMHKLSVARQQPASAFRSSLVTDRFSVLMSTFNRIETVRRLIKYYRRSPLVDALFLTWHNPHAEPPQALLDLADAVVFDNASEVDWDAIAQSRAAKADQKQQGSDAYLATVIIVRQQTDTLNNRFNPIAGIRTPSVLMIDDDIRIPLRDLQVGDSTRWDYKYHYGPIAAHRDYSMMLTKGMFLGTDLLFAYTCLLPPRVHAYIDAIKNCEDIAMNFVASGHQDARSRCLRDLAVLFGKMPLQSTSIEVNRYTDNAPFVFGELRDWQSDE